MCPCEGQQITDGTDCRASNRGPGFRQHEQVGTPSASRSWVGEVTNSGTAQDGFLSRGARVIHADSCVDLTLEEIMIRGTSDDFKQSPRHDHSAIGVADVLVWAEEHSTGLSKPFDVGRERIVTPGIREKQVGVYPIGMRQEMTDADLFSSFGRRQFELRHVRDDSLIEVNGTALDLLEHKSRGQKFRDGAKKESGVLNHRCPGDNVCYPVCYDGLVPAVVDAAKISRDLVRIAIGNCLFAKMHRDV